MEFTKAEAMCRLAVASPSLQAADVIGVWLDMNGSGWGGDYKIAIATEEKFGRDVTIKTGPQAGDKVWMAYLSPPAQIAVSEALAGLDAGEYVLLSYVVRERWPNNGEKIWPIIDLVAVQRQRIADAEREIARLEQLGEPRCAG